MSRKTYKLVISFTSIVFAISAIATSLLLPKFQKETPPNYFLFAFDISRSMTAEDYMIKHTKFSRLYVAKKAAENMISQLPSSSKISLAGFLGKAPSDKNLMIFLPYVEKTENLHEIKMAFNIIDSRNAWTTGSNIYALIEELSTMKFVNKTTVFIFTDGGDYKAIKETLSEAINRLKENRNINIIFIGTGENSNVSLIPDFDEYGEKLDTYLKDNKGESFQSKLEESLLISIANELGAKYKRLKSPTDTREIMANTLAQTLKSNWLTVYNFFMIIALICFIFYLII